MAHVIAVRHAMPVVDAALPPGQWALSADGAVAARALRDSLPELAVAVASDERKAQDTLRLALGRHFQVDARFGEVRRPGEPVGEDVIPARRSWVGGCLDARHAGWETPGEVAERFERGVCAGPPGDLIVATHGMCLTDWLVHCGWVPGGEDAVRFWEHLGFPDVVTVPR